MDFIPVPHPVSRTDLESAVAVSLFPNAMRSNHKKGCDVALESQPWNSGFRV